VAAAGTDRRALAGAALRHKPALRPAVTDADLVTATSPIAPAVSSWEDPPRGAPADGAPVLSIDGFAGPLDWLLEMARAKKIDLARLSIGALIEAFSRAMQAALAGRDRSRI